MDFIKYGFKIENSQFIPIDKNLKNIIQKFSWKRKVKDIGKMFYNQQEAERQAEKILYEVYRIGQAWGLANEIRKKYRLEWDITILHPGKIGQEYFKTKGHFHLPLNGIIPAEAYQVISGTGMLIMQDKRNNVYLYEIKPNQTIFIEGDFAHGLSNTGLTPLIIVGCVPVEAGHAYEPIENLQGFAKLILENNIVNNPHYETSLIGELIMCKTTQNTPNLYSLYEQDPANLRDILVDWVKHPLIYEKKIIS